MRFRFVEEHRGSFPAARLCEVVGVSARGLRAFRSRPASRRQRSDLVTLAHIKEQSRLSLGSYGRPRMTEELKEIGLNVGHRRVGRLMRQNEISVVRTHPGVSEAQVFGVPDTRLGEEVCAWIVSKPGSVLTDSMLRSYCDGQIAHFKVPQHIRIVEELPMTITGKPQKFLMRDQMIEELEGEAAG